LSAFGWADQWVFLRAGQRVGLMVDEWAGQRVYASAALLVVVKDGG